jgi:exodeoxyribonuclease VIII
VSQEYFSRPGHNWSSIKLMEDSALAYKHGLDNPREDTPALALGRVVHSLVFEPETIATDYAVFTGAKRQGKAWDAFAAANDGKTIFKENEIEEARAMATAIRRHPLVKPYLAARGEFERVVTWTDPETGLFCKGKFDWIIPSQRILIDLKTTRSIAPRRFAADVARYKYHGQLGGHYSNGCEFGLGWRPERVIIIAADKSAPFDVAVYELDDAGKECGKELAALLLDRVKWCEEHNEWPGAQFDWESRTLTESTLELPGWLYGGADLEITYEADE